jgi:hypothetical protein
MPRVAKTFNGNLEQALAADSEHLYIGNNLKGHAVLLFEIKDSSGKAIGIKLPRTWVPIDLMLFADRESIKRSDSLRKLHRKGAIKFLDPKDANEIMQTAEAKKEANRAGLLGDIILDEEESSERLEKEVNEITSNGTSELDYYKNTIGEIKGIVTDNGEDEEIVNKIKDMESAYFSDTESVSKGDLILLLEDAKSFLSDKGRASASEEIANMISSLKE